jgi:glucan endo-1,3-beta-D-glucosidase
MRPSTALAAAGIFAAGASAENYLGFNSGATLADRSAKFKKDFKAEFETAQGLVNAPGTFNAVRLYTNVQAYSKDDPIEAFEAAIETNTKILLGVWASGVTDINSDISALKKAVTKFGSKFTDLVIGISIGSEDLYRTSETGIKNEAGVGTGPKQIVGFINDFKSAFADSPLGKVPVGHVDTWDVWVNGTNQPVIDAIDWIGVDEYPYYENGKGNNIKNAGSLFDRAFDATVAASGGKPVWVTETGWPSSGPSWDQAVSSVDNAKYYWNEVGCRKLFGKVPTFWYNLRDSNPDNKMKFAITNNLSTKPFFDLTCPTTFDTPSATATSGSSSSTGVSAPGSSSTGSSTSGSGSGSGSSGSGTTTGSASNPSKSSSASLGKAVTTTATGSALALVAALFAALL